MCIRDSARTIHFVNDQKEVIYVFSAPYMVDAEGTESNGVSLSIVSQKKNKADVYKRQP